VKRLKDLKKYEMFSSFPQGFGYNMYAFKPSTEEQSYDMYTDALDLGGLLLSPCHHDDHSPLSVIDPETNEEVCSSYGLDSDDVHEHLAHIHSLLGQGMEKKEKPFHGYNASRHSKTGGLNDSYRKKVNRETGSNLKRPVTGKVKPGSKAAKRRKSFCARMSGTSGPTSKDGKLTPKGAALKRWRCSKSEEVLEKRCWEGYKPAPGKKPYSKGSCIKKGTKLEHYSPQENLKEISPSFQGQGVDVRARRSTEHPHSFYYRAGTEPEQLVAGQARSKYSVEIPDEAKLYDLSMDQDGHIKEAIAANQGALNMDLVHERLKNNGYHGFYASKHPHGLENVVALYHSEPVKSEEKLGER
jgi:hypothetical protein